MADKKVLVLFVKSMAVERQLVQESSKKSMW